MVTWAFSRRASEAMQTVGVYVVAMTTTSMRRLQCAAAAGAPRQPGIAIGTVLRRSGPYGRGRWMRPGFNMARWSRAD